MGTGAIMAVPAHDKRDYEFAEKYNLEIIPVTKSEGFVSYTKDIKNNLKKYTLINSEAFNGKTFQQSRSEILEKLVELGVATKKMQFKLRDWSISRQRFGEHLSR